MAIVQLNNDVVLISIKSDRQSDISRHFAIPLNDIAEVRNALNPADLAALALESDGSRCVSDARNADNAVVIRLKRGSTRLFVLDVAQTESVQRIMAFLR